MQSIFCAQSEASVRLTAWKWSGESRYPGALPNDCLWVSKDVGQWKLLVYEVFEVL